MGAGGGEAGRHRQAAPYVHSQCDYSDLHIVKSALA